MRFAAIAFPTDAEMRRLHADIGLLTARRILIMGWLCRLILAVMKWARRLVIALNATLA